MCAKRNTRQTKTGQVNARIEPELYEKLEQIAKAEQRTVSQLARMAIQEYIRRKEVTA